VQGGRGGNSSSDLLIRRRHGSSPPGGQVGVESAVGTEGRPVHYKFPAAVEGATTPSP
jgi:hypothetical protein